MSIRAINWAFDWKVGSPITKLVLIRLADYANDSDECWPSIKTISQDTELGESTVRKHIKELVRLGCVIVVPRMSDDGMEYYSNKYKLSVRPFPTSGIGSPTS
jgi:pyocin large subunit-like protein